MPEQRPPLFPLEGRSLTLLERGQALFACMDRRIAAMERRQPLPDLTDEEIQAELDEEIVRIETRRMLERVVAGEPWAEIRASATQGPPATSRSTRSQPPP